MESLRIIARYWKMISPKLPSFLGWRRAKRNPCLDSIVYMRRSKGMADFPKGLYKKEIEHKRGISVLSLPLDR